MSRKIPVIYIVGSSHSGSTLLDLLLGSHSSVESVGEAKKIPAVFAQVRKGAGPRCTCRLEIAACPLWADLLANDPGDLKRDAAANARMFERVLRARGKSVVLDSSKTIGRALLLSRSDLFEPLFVHLVRDSRAVVYSSKRKRSKQPTKGHGLFATATGWQKLNARILRRLCRKGTARCLLVRYEDLTANPGHVLGTILGAAGLSWEPSMLNFREHVHHNIEGNRMRMGSDSEIRRDDEYLRSLGKAEWALATLLTWRGLRRFGYPLKRSPVAAEAGATPSLR